MIWEAGGPPRPAWDMVSILEVRNLYVRYSSHTGVASSAIVDVSFDVKPGEILGMLGESGSGKSTLAASLLRLLPANGKIQQGSILFEGRDILQAELRELESIRGRRIALINQDPLVALHQAEVRTRHHSDHTQSLATGGPG